MISDMTATTRYTCLSLVIDSVKCAEEASRARANGCSEVYEIAVWIAGKTYPLTGKTFTAEEFLERLGFSTEDPAPLPFATTRLSTKKLT